VGSVNPDAVEIDAPFVTRSICEFFICQVIWVEAKTLGDWDKREVWEKVADAEQIGYKQVSPLNWQML
jgi:hypothetical protein